jgi:protein-disulfide isomerase
MKSSGEAKLLIILGIIVLLGGGVLVGMNVMGDKVTPTTPRATPRPFDITAEKFDKLLKTARHVEGDPKIPVTIVEFADFECPSCRRAYNNVLKNIVGRKMARVAFFHYPFAELHPSAIPAAIGSEAAAKQGKFWEMYAALFDGEMVQLSPDYITEQAKKIGLDMKRYEADIKDAKLKDLINRDRSFAEEYKVDMTPTFFVRDSEGKLYRAVGGDEFKRLAETVFR